ncbi:dicarboxylate/amino acid:cation symporter [Bhargavaea beijingensis]|uniref:Na+/H+-dicarboxylate symporter n=2 Tax=Bhargavaea beijingensis TaxID=426756 RepID=A0A1G7GNW4_9BACL|nr:dicarboxylate/amino acid:cation symporter [Bhargavaea beijingensis]MCW1929632.1 dicarboxylate/amino acid:cation symporter [Bhargavaea beijingensis]SDE89802.1 Na+/H+-dicarboxylate symporter [Bhargavaea beijingensis]
MGAIWRFYRDRSFMMKMSAGFLLGIVVGLIFGESAGVLSPLGELLLRLLNLIVIPLVVFTLIAAVDQLNPAKLGRIGGKVFTFYFITTGIAIIVGILLALLIRPGVGLTLPNAEVDVPERPSVTETLLGIVPDNLFSALANADILGLIFISVVVGLSISSMLHSGEERIRKMGHLLGDLTVSLSEVTFRVLNGILQYAPIGIFAIAASAIGSQGLQTLISLGKLTVVIYGGIALQFILVYFVIMKLFGVRIGEFFRNVKDAIGTAFMTSSSLGTLPVTMKAAKRAGISDEVASFSLPLGATVNMDGAAIRLGASVVFAADIVGLDLGFSAILGIIVTGTLASVGTAGVPGAGLIALSIVLTQAGLPIEVVALVAGIDAILGMGATATNITGDLVGASIVDKSEKQRQAKPERSG